MANLPGTKSDSKTGSENTATATPTITTNAQPARGDETRAQLLDAALELFA
ncbi:MAG: TetR/AcrR family transcriptional regulator, partial [Rhodospirillaceae bacterium]|nr:TetR/AcrR family transcriptional regulator [Rhodospirillaceae bacterium]MBT7570350.1 TetR/AcrR family transcriptional regulator [Rhodospirillaceae bacterium]